jgi:hypothetical protein
LLQAANQLKRGVALGNGCPAFRERSVPRIAQPSLLHRLRRLHE